MACIVAFLTLPAWAADPLVGTVDLYRAGHGAYERSDIYAGGVIAADYYTGVYMLEKSAGTGDGNIWANGPLPGFCIEIEEPASGSTRTYGISSVADAYNGLLGETIGAAKADYLSQLWGKYYDPAWAGTGPFTYYQNRDAAAFAAAVWEIVYEDLPASPYDWDVRTDDSAGTPGFAITGIYEGRANLMLNSLNGTGPRADLAILVNDGAQNYLVAVPEPTTLVLLGLGGALGCIRRKRRTVRMR